MKLRFHAREDFLVREAGVAPSIGQAARYYGRTFDPATRGYPAVKDAVEFEQGTEDADKCSKQCRKGCMWAADKDTAAALGVAFVDVAFSEGAWIAKAGKETIAVNSDEGGSREPTSPVVIKSKSAAGGKGGS